MFSLQALARVPITDTMQLVVSLRPASLVAFLDSGNTHNFISELAAQRTGLPLHQRPRLTAEVANGERVTCADVLKATPLAIDGITFSANLFVMPLAGYDVVSSSGTWPAAQYCSSTNGAPYAGPACQSPAPRLSAPPQPAHPSWMGSWRLSRTSSPSPWNCPQAHVEPPPHPQAVRPAGGRPPIQIPGGPQGRA
jgi:hypothetical protein